MDVDEVLSGNCAPVSDNLLLDVFLLERFSHKRVVEQIELSCCKIVCCTPVCVHLLQVLIRNDIVIHLSYLFAINDSEKRSFRVVRRILRMYVDHIQKTL